MFAYIFSYLLLLYLTEVRRRDVLEAFSPACAWIRRSVFQFLTQIDTCADIQYFHTCVHYAYPWRLWHGINAGYVKVQPRRPFITHLFAPFAIKATMSFLVFA